MTHNEAKDFVDCVAFGEARVKYHGKSYFCNGVSFDSSTGDCHIEVFQDEPASDEENWRDSFWSHDGKSREECMVAFVNVKYWGGKSFYEAAPEMEWID